MLLLLIRNVVMVILCIELNYYYLNPKITPIFLDPNRNSISVIYIAIDLTKLFTWILSTLINCDHLHLKPHVEGDEHDRLKHAGIKPDLMRNTNGKVYTYIFNRVKVFPIYRVLPMCMNFVWVLLIFVCYIV